MKEIIGANIKRLMHKRGVTQKRMAETIGRCENSVNKWANGASMPDAEAMYRIAKALRVDLMDLYKGVNEVEK